MTHIGYHDELNASLSTGWRRSPTSNTGDPIRSSDVHGKVVITSADAIVL